MRVLSCSSSPGHRPPHRDRTLLGFEWDTHFQNSVKIAQFNKRAGRQFWLEQDRDLFEMQAPPLPAKDWPRLVEKISQLAMRETWICELGVCREVSDFTRVRPHDVFGEPCDDGYGLHIHVDCKSAFATKREARNFIVTILNYLPLFNEAFRASHESFSRDPDRGDLSELRSYFKERLYDPKVSLHEFIFGIADIFPDKFLGINFLHSHLGESGTLELRFFRSPGSVKELNFYGEFVAALLEYSESFKDEIPLQLKGKTIQDFYQMVEQVAGNRDFLRRGLDYHCLLFDSPAYVPFKTDPPLAKALKAADHDTLSALLGQEGVPLVGPKGTHPLVYSLLAKDEKSLEILLAKRKWPELQQPSFLNSLGQVVQSLHRRDTDLLAPLLKALGPRQKIKLAMALETPNQAIADVIDLELVKLSERLFQRPTVLSLLKRPYLHQSLFDRLLARIDRPDLLFELLGQRSLPPKALDHLVSKLLTSFSKRQFIWQTPLLRPSIKNRLLYRLFFEEGLLKEIYGKQADLKEKEVLCFLLSSNEAIYHLINAPIALTQKALQLLAMRVTDQDLSGHLLTKHAHRLGLRAKHTLVQRIHSEEWAVEILKKPQDLTSQEALIPLLRSKKALGEVLRTEHLSDHQRLSLRLKLNRAET